MNYKRLEIVHLAVKVEPRKRRQNDATMFREVRGQRKDWPSKSRRWRFLICLVISVKHHRRVKNHHRSNNKPISKT